MKNIFLIFFLILPSIALPSLVLAHSETDDLIVIYSEEISKNPENAKNYLKRGSLYLEHSELLKAEKDFLIAKRLDPKNPEVYFYLSRLEKNRAKYSLSLNYIDKAISLNNRNTIFYLERSVIFEKQEQYKPAIKDLNKVIELSSKASPELYLKRYHLQQKINTPLSEIILGLEEATEKLGELVTITKPLREAKQEMLLGTK